MKVLMKPGWYRNNVCERVVISMRKENGTQKGVQTILKEKGKHTNAAGKALILQCENCGERVSHDQRSEGMRSYLCCASYVLPRRKTFWNKKNG